MKPSVALVVGFIQWLSVGTGSVAGYLLTISGFADWNWFHVSTGALFHLSAGLGALSVHLKKRSDERAALIEPEVRATESEASPLFDDSEYTDIIDLGSAKP